jgi:eukaryotic-like serine/threonine-protein kinase
VSPDSVRDRLQASLGTAYHLERELGGGGMSRVFVAEETGLTRTVVVKVLSPDLAEALNVERFRREIQLAARLQHPHIVPLLTAGEAGGLPYFTMPFISGESLRQRLIARGELPVTDAVRVLREVASALAYAHANGVVHRDIKPDNVMISGGSAMVMDFGVAKAVSDAATSRGSTLTQFGVALGTPAYMAPEQAAADPATDHRADIYAFGVMAYELLTGETPFAGRPAQAMLAAHAIETPEPISRRRPAVPDALASLIMRSLEKRPSDRPQTADEIVRVLDNLPTSTGAIRATTAGARRRPYSWLVGAALGALVVIIGAAVFVTQKQHKEPAADAPTMLAVLPFSNQGPSSDQYFADGLTDAITNRLASLHGLGVIDSRSAAQYKDTKKSPKDIGKELGVQYLLEGTVQWATDEHGKRQVQISPALVDVANLTTKPAGGPYLVEPSDVFKVQTEVATKVADALNVALNGEEQKLMSERPTWNPQAYDAYLRGESFDKQNEGLSPDAIHHAMDAYGEATRLDPKFAQAFAKLARDQINWAILDLTDSSRISASRRSIDSALALEPDLPEAHVARAHFLAFFQKDFAGAYDELVRAHALKPSDAEVLSDLGRAQIGQGDVDQGLANIAKAVKLDPRSLAVIQRAASESYNRRRYNETERYANLYIQLAPTSSIGYAWKINAEVDGRGDTAAAHRTIDAAVASGVRMSISLASQYTNFGPTGWAIMQRMSLADVNASQFIDSVQYYGIEKIIARAQGRLDVERAYGDSLLTIGVSPRFTGPLEFARYTILADAYSALGRAADAQRQITSLEQYIDRLRPDDHQRGELEQAIADAFATLGQADSAVAHLRILLALPSGFSLYTARTDITYWPIRNSPVWQRFVAGQ